MLSKFVSFPKRNWQLRCSLAAIILLLQRTSTLLDLDRPKLLTLTLDHSISLTAHGERGLLTNNSKPRPPDVPDIAHSRQHWSIKMYYVHPKKAGVWLEKGRCPKDKERNH